MAKLSPTAHTSLPEKFGVLSSYTQLRPQAFACLAACQLQHRRGERFRLTRAGAVAPKCCDLSLHCLVRGEAMLSSANSCFEDSAQGRRLPAAASFKPVSALQRYVLTCPSAVSLAPDGSRRPVANSGHLAATQGQMGEASTSDRSDAAEVCGTKSFIAPPAVSANVDRLRRTTHLQALLQDS